VQDASGAYNSFTNAFRPGQTVTFWGTGFGPIASDDAAPPPTGNLAGTSVTAIVGGQAGTVQYAGRSGFAGVDQINVTIPSGVSGCFVQVGLFVNGVPSNFTSIAVSDGGSVCSDPNLFTSADIQRVAAGNSMRFGATLLTQVSATGTLAGLRLTLDYETGESYYQSYDPASFLNSLSGLGTLAVSSGSCGVFQYSGGGFADPVRGTALDAGGAINVSNGTTSNKMEKSPATGRYQGSFSNLNPLAPSTPFLKPGETFSLDNATGGQDVGAFKISTTLPTAIQWTNKPTGATIPRSQDLRVTWSGGDPNSYVYVIGDSPFDASAENGVECVCVGKNSDGGMTVPKEILSTLPVSASGPLVPGVSGPLGRMFVNATTVTRSTVSGLDVFLNAANSGDAKGTFIFQ
jgi:hypothetical protein